MGKTFWTTFLLAAAAFAESGAGLHWTAPGAWKNQGTRPMRLATYDVPPAAGDGEAGECGVYYFGQGQGGSAPANLDRWISQIQQPKAAAQVKKRTVHGLAVSTVDVSGTYTGMGGPMAAAHTAKAGYRLLGAIVEGPQGSIFFKFTGPAKTVAANEKDFQKLVDSVNKD